MYDNIAAAPKASDSDALMARLVNSVKNNWGGVAAVNAYKYNPSFYRVTGQTPTTDMEFDDCQNKGYLDSNFKKVLTGVPIPANAQPGAGSDGLLAIHDTENDTLWEFWKAKRTSTGWSACWGGRIDNVSQSPGYFSKWLGASATGLAMSGLAISMDEVRAGRIDHAVGITVIDAKKYNDYSWPAQRSDGFIDAPDAMPEGRRLRLDPTLDVDSLGLSPFATMVAKAAQKHGFVVYDKGGAVAVLVESGEPEKARTGTDPWPGLFNNTPSYRLMAGFPWDKVDVLPDDYGKP